MSDKPSDAGAVALPAQKTPSPASTVLARSLRNLLAALPPEAAVSWVRNGTGHIAYMLAQEAACAALRIPSPSSAWRSMDSAPERGVSFLVWLADEQFATIAYWRTHDYGETDLYLPAMDDYADDHVVTHWQPLPFAPEQEGVDAALPERTK